MDFGDKIHYWKKANNGAIVMAKAATKTTKTPVKNDFEIEPWLQIDVRKEVVLKLVPIEGFMELELPVQLSIIDTLVTYILTGTK